MKNNLSIYFLCATIFMGFYYVQNLYAFEIDEYIPHKYAKQWVHERTITYEDNKKPSETVEIITKALGEEIVDGIIHYKSLKDDKRYKYEQAWSVDTEGIKIRTRLVDGWSVSAYLLKLPLKAGTNWSIRRDYKNGKYKIWNLRIEEVGTTINTRYGVFRNCIHKKSKCDWSNSGTNIKSTVGDTWFCPKKGMVKHTQKTVYYDNSTSKTVRLLKKIE